MTARKKVDVTLVVAEKQCSACGEVKPRSEFGPSHYSSTGLESQCRSCKAAYQRAAYLKKNKDKPLPRSRPRRPLPDFAKDAGWRLRQDVERMERIFADDRFSTYELQVTASVRGHLEHAAQVCRDLLGRIDHPTGE